MLYAPALATLVLVGCTTTPTSPEREIITLQTTMLSTIDLVEEYRSQPPCEPPQRVTLCYDDHVYSVMYRGLSEAQTSLTMASEIVARGDDGYQYRVRLARQALGVVTAELVQNGFVE